MRLVDGIFPFLRPPVENRITLPDEHLMVENEITYLENDGEGDKDKGLRSLRHMGHVLGRSMGALQSILDHSGGGDVFVYGGRCPISDSRV